MKDFEAFLHALRLRFFPEWKHPYAVESVYRTQQERHASEQVYNWHVLHLAEL